eukprot:Amastigsp_a678841_165.p2 type:complete len:357 gc:universal Amastigsp_a678841_165:1291-221(-)
MYTGPTWPRIVAMNFPVSPAQSLTDLSNDADATRFPSGENTTELTGCWWPVSRATGFLLSYGAQRMSVWSSDAVIIRSLEPSAHETASYRARAFATRSSTLSVPLSGTWSCAPVRSTKSDESASELTQCPCPSYDRTRRPSSSDHARTDRSCEPVKMSPAPDHRRQVTDRVCPEIVNTVRPVYVSRTRTVQSFDADARYRASGSRCSGFHASATTAFVCPLIGLPSGAPVAPSQTRISPALHADARRVPSGDQETQSTQFRWPSSVWIGVAVSTSQSRTVVSPEPDAARSESGLKCVERTASVCPGIVPVHRVTARTRKSACGWYTITIADSVERPCSVRVAATLVAISSSERKNE